MNLIHTIKKSRTPIFLALCFGIFSFIAAIPSKALAAELPIPGKTNVGLVKYAYEAVEEGWGYIRGASGQTLTESRLQYFIAAEPEIYDTEEKVAQAQLWLGKRVADCSGLIKAYLYKDEDGKNISSLEYPFVTGMSSVWYNTTDAAEKGPIETMPETLGLILYRLNHVAIYIGHGKIIEAKGLKYGVTISEFNPSDWEMWVKPHCIDYLSDGFYTVGDTVYCLSNGLISTGWITDTLGNIYYVDTEGNTFTGVRNINGSNYLFSETGICYGNYTDDGLVFNDGEYYYYRAGEKQSGWIDLNGKKLYFSEDGKQLRSTAAIIEGHAKLFMDDGTVNSSAGDVVSGGYTYKCNHNGEPMRGYIEGVFYGEHFLPHTGFQNIGPDLFYFRDGQLLKPGFNLIDDNWYYINNDGSVVTGSMVLRDRTYSCGITGEISIGGNSLETAQ